MNLWKTVNYGKGVNEPFLINTPAGLPSGLLKRLIREGYSPREAFKKAWKIKKGSKNPSGSLMIVNSPRKRKRGDTMKRRRRRRVAGRRRRRYLTRNPIGNPLAGLSLNRKMRRRRYRRNPVVAIPVVGKFDFPKITELAGAVGGFIAVKAVPSMVFPANWQIGIMRVASQGIVTIGASLLANRFLGRGIGKMVLVGGLVAIGSELAGQALVKMGVPLGVYLQPQDMGYYMTPAEQTV